MTKAVDRLTAALADRYRIERELGQCGMATVYLAHDIRHARKVAIKVLRPEVARALGADRYLREIRTTAALQHPHILTLIDSGQTAGLPDGHDGGQLFYVLPYVAGKALREYVTRDKPLTIEEAVRLARGVAAALDFAHRQGVVHRDIQPENILLHEAEPMVADFGIAVPAGETRVLEVP